MKKIILLLLAVACVILMKAQSKSSQLHILKTNEAYEKISAGENVKIIFTQWPGNGITIKGKDKADISVKAGVLSVKKKSCCKKGIITVTIPAQGIKSIELNDGAFAFSEGQLQCDNLVVFVKGSSYFDLKSNGMINVVYDEGLEPDVKKVKNKKLLQVISGY